MSIDRTEDLLKKYPFMENCQLELGDRYYIFLKDLLNKINFAYRTYSLDKTELEIFQIKSKFGELRVYTGTNYDCPSASPEEKEKIQKGLEKISFYISQAESTFLVLQEYFDEKEL